MKSKLRFSVVEMLIVFAIIGLIASVSFAGEVVDNMNFKGVVNFDNGCVLKIKGSQVTATAAQLNAAGAASSANLKNVVGSIAGTASTGVAVGGTNYVKITLSDLNGTAMASKTAARVWFSSTSVAAPATNTISATTALTGTVVVATTAACDLFCVTDTNGVITIKTVSGAGPYTNYCNIATGGYVVPITCAVTNNP